MSLLPAKSSSHGNPTAVACVKILNRTRRLVSAVDRHNAELILLVGLESADLNVVFVDGSVHALEAWLALLAVLNVEVRSRIAREVGHPGDLGLA